jgi:hypothetical protein
MCLPLILNNQDEIYKINGISYGSLRNLESMGLVSYAENGISITKPTERVNFKYFNSVYILDIELEYRDNFPVGKIIFTDLGFELMGILALDPVPGFTDYIIENWLSNKRIIPIPTPNS